MARPATQGDFLDACDEALAAAKINAGQQPVVDDLSLQLEKEIGSMREARARRNVHKAAAQQASRDLDGAMESAKKIYSRLRHMLIALFGLSSEKLAEFGFQPFRPQPASTESKVKRFLERENGKETPPENGHEPTQAARPQTDLTN
jgi:hypothetical protein